MPTVSVANFENEELLSNRLLSFMTNNDHSSVGYDSLSVVNNSNGFVSSANFTPSYSIPSDSDYINCLNMRNLSRNGSTPTMNMSHERTLETTAVAVTKESPFGHSSSTGLVSGSCTPPPTFIPSSIGSYLQRGAPSHSALTSPCLGTKLSANVTSILNYNSERHSLQNSPFYSHYPLTGTVSGHINRHFNGVSSSNVGSLMANGNGGSLSANARNSLCQDPMFTGCGPRSSSSGCPQRELFPNLNSSQQINTQNVFGSGLHVQDRLYYYALAAKYGFIVGSELDRVKDNSCRSTSQSYGRIAAHFRNRYGETEAKTKAAYLQIGVRVPSKDHVSEIVGKGGQKIKLIREETGALITTPGEHEEHVFIIEAPPEIAMRVAHHLTTRAHEITQSKLAVSERRRGSTSSQQQQQQSITGVDSTFSGSTGNGSICTINGGASCTTSATAGIVSPRGLLSMTGITGSVQNSPLHPSVASVVTAASSTQPPTPGGQQHPRSNGTGLAGGIFQGSPSANGGGAGAAFSSAGVLAPGNSPVSCLFGPTSGCTSGAVGTPPATGSRILLARGRISVPQEMVGKIIGTQGSIITTIQKDTGTEIKSPPKEAARGPNATSEFEISAYQGLGLNSNQAAEYRVQQAKQLIGHLVMRQLERRASEEVEEIWSTGCTPSGDDCAPVRANNGGCGGGANAGIGGGSSSSGSNGSTPRISNAGGWMWPDVVQMDSQEAREVLDRILAESKNKTRRAKEIAAASASQSPTSSVSVMSPHTGSTGGVVVVGAGGVASAVIDHHHQQQQHSHHQQQQQQLRHLLSSSNLFSTGAGCVLDADVIGESVTGRSASSAVAVAAAFNGHRHQFALTGSGVSGGLLDRLQNAPNSSAACSIARTISSNHNCMPNGDGLNVFSRSPGSQIPCDPWTSEISSPHHHFLPGGGSNTTNNNSCSSVNQSQFAISPSGASAPPPPLGLEASRRNTDLNKPSFFDFNHTATDDLGTEGFLLHHHHQQLLSPASDLFQQLNQRHGVWVNNGTSEVLKQQHHHFPELLGSSGSPIVTKIETTSTSQFVISSDVEPSNEGLALSCQEKEKTLVENSIFSTHNYDIMKALDQLYIGQTAGEDQTIGLDRESAGPPPGFELQHHQQQLQRQHRKSSDESSDSGAIFSSFSKLPSEEDQLLLFDHHHHHHQHELSANSSSNSTNSSGGSSHPWCNNTGRCSSSNINQKCGDGEHQLGEHPSSFSTSILLRSIFGNRGSDAGAFADAGLGCGLPSAPGLSSAAAAIWSQSAANATAASAAMTSGMASADDRPSEEHQVVGLSRSCGAIGEGRRRSRRDENSGSSSSSAGSSEEQQPPAVAGGEQVDHQQQSSQQLAPPTPQPVMVVPLSTATEVA